MLKPRVVASSAVALVFVVLAQWVPASAVEGERYDWYWHATARICEGRVTPEFVKGTEEFAAALAREATPVEVLGSGGGVAATAVSRKVLIRATDYPHGRTTNFWGPRPPEIWRSSCVQAP